jgi:hypothetical protein
VWGALYRVSLADKKRLDRIEGLGRDYLEFRVAVDSPLRPTTQAFIYRASPTVIDPGRKPFGWYLRLCVEGARQHALPPAWIEMLEAVDAVPDPQPERHARELAVLGGRS